MKNPLRFLVLIMGCGLIAYVLWHAQFYALLLETAHETVAAKSRRKALLCQTNHEVLLEACRTVLRELPPGRYDIRIDRHPATREFPKIILGLKPTYVVIASEGSLRIEIFGGMSHAGVLAYPKDFVPPYEGFGFGDKELIDGLWYYDDGYRKVPNFDKEIDRIMGDRSPEKN